MRVFIFGDSIAQGFYDSKGGWAQRLANEYHQKNLRAMNTGANYHIEVFNLAVSGDTIEGILSRVKHEVGARRLYEDNDLIIVSIGTNDSVLRNNLVVQDVYEFQENIEKLVQEASKLTNNILFVGLSAVEESLTNPWKFSSTGKQYKNNRIDLFEDTIKQVAEMNDIAFVPVYNKFLSGLNSGHNLLSDGLHPNDAGHKLMYKLVKPKLEELLK